MTDRIWTSAEQSTIDQLFRRRLETDPDSEYVDVNGTKLSAAQVMSDAERIGAALATLGTQQHDRVATLIENSPSALLAWVGTVCYGRVAVPINTAYKGEYLRHQLVDSGSRVIFVASSLYPRVAEIIDGVPDLDHVVVVDDGEPADEPATPAAVTVHPWDDLMAAGGQPPAVTISPSDLGTFIYTGGTTGLSKGCMLSHNYHAALAQQIAICWQRTSDDVAWTPLPMYHFNALTTVVIGTLLSGGRGAIYRRFSVSQFWPEMNRVGATITSTLGTMAYLLAHDADRPEMPLSGAREANTHSVCWPPPPCRWRWTT